MNLGSGLYKWIKNYTIRDKIIMSILAAVLSLFLCIGDSFQQKNLLLYLCNYNAIFGYLAVFIMYFIILLLIMTALDGLIEASKGGQRVGLIRSSQKILGII